MKKLRIMIVDESPFFRGWLRRLILTLPGVQIIGETKDPFSALKFIHILKPDAILMDAKTQWRLGVDLIASIRRITPVPRVIMLTCAIYGRYQRTAAEKADFLLDKFTEYYRIPEILNSFASGSTPVSKRVPDTL